MTRHSKKRLCQRSPEINTFADSRRYAIQAWRSGLTIGDFCKYPDFMDYLRRIKKKTSNTASIRVYRGLIYIWRGERSTLVTAYKIPYRFAIQLAGEEEVTEEENVEEDEVET